MPPPKEPRQPAFNRKLVEGPILPAIWAIAWPTLLQNLVGSLQGLVDHIMVGHYVGFHGNAAIGVAWQIFLVIIVFVASIASGMAVLVARFAGAGDEDRVNRVVYQALLTAVGLSALILAPIGYFLAPSLLRLVHAEPAVMAEALPYIRTLFLFGVGMLIFFILGGALRAAGDAKTPLRLGLMMTVLNLGLNVVLIRGLGPIPAFGTLGAAMGTAIASAIVAVVGFYQLFGGKLVVRFQRGMRFLPDWGIIRSLFRFGLPTGFQGIAMNLGGVVLVGFVGSLAHSAEAQAVYSVSYTQLFAFITFTASALMAAASTVAGQSLGAQDPERASRAPRAAATVGLGVAIPFGLLFLAAPGWLLGLFGMEGEIIVGLGSQLLAFLSLSGLFLVTALSYTGALQGTGDTKSPLYITLVSQLLLPIGLCTVLRLLHGNLEPHHIWISIVLGHFTRATLSVLRFGQGHWRDIDVNIGD